jgi:hypothetical protein
MVVPNTRQRITAQDLAFALSAVAQDSPPATEGKQLVPEKIDVDDLLDSRAVFEALVRTSALLSVSPYFFYYILVRQAFLDRGIGERTVADYASSLLIYFLKGERLRAAASGPRSFIYLVDLIDSVSRARTPQAAFAMEARIGDVALFLTGIFPDAIYHRQTYGRRLPGLEYYEAVGRSGYRSAAKHPPPRYADLADVLDFIASEFRLVRQALNDLADTHFCLRRGKGESVDRVLRQALYGGDSSEDERPWVGDEPYA